MEERAVAEVLRSGWVSQGPKCSEFENAVASFVGVRHARAVNSGTGALHLTLLACGIRPGDEVIVPAFTCVATLNPLESIGAKPVLVDVNSRTFALEAEGVRNALTPRTKAIIVVHLFGLPASIEPIVSLAGERGVLVIEDAALSLGASINARAVGTFGSAAFLSFHPRKMITTGEGGMVLTGSTDIAEVVAALRNYGASVDALQRHRGQLFELASYDRAGFNFKLTDIQATIGLAQLKKLPEMIRRRRAIARRYTESLADLSWLALPEEPGGSTHVYQSYACMLRPGLHPPIDVGRLAVVQRRFFEYLASRGIATVQGAQAIPTTAYYRQKYGWPPEAYPLALLADRGSVCLPIYPDLSTDEQDYVIAAVRSFDP